MNATDSMESCASEDSLRLQILAGFTHATDSIDFADAVDSLTDLIASI